MGHRLTRSVTLREGIDRRHHPRAVPSALAVNVYGLIDGIAHELEKQRNLFGVKSGVKSNDDPDAENGEVAVVASSGLSLRGELVSRFGV
jgi:hypothetical protein